MRSQADGYSAELGKAEARKMTCLGCGKARRANSAVRLAYVNLQGLSTPAECNHRMEKCTRERTQTIPIRSGV